ncbi:MAG TPA: hypothetical protein VFH87_01690 [Candidatus Udaeobacter sp.]|nr:hypothetical protein [Candidatus Udaeobacter sp.]
MNIHDFITPPPGNTFNYYDYLEKHPMKHYNEYTEEDVEDLARYCERLAERVCALEDETACLIELSSKLLNILQRTTSFEDLDSELLRDLPRIGATPRMERTETPLDGEVPF